MKKNVLVKTGERTETRIRTIPAQYNEMGEIIAGAYDETYTINVPIMEPRNIEMTVEEIAELERMQAQTPATPPEEIPSLESRVGGLETEVQSIKTGLLADNTDMAAALALLGVEKEGEIE